MISFQVADRYLLVEQLNASQWHATGSDAAGKPVGGGVANWVGAVAEAMVSASLSVPERGVISIDLDGNQLVLVAPGGGL